MPDKFNLELLLRDLYESISELSLVLDREHAALAADDVDALQKATVDKERLSEKIAEQDKQRKCILEEKGLENNLAGMEQLIRQASIADENALYKLWNMISQLGQDCSTKNKLIGVIIEAKRRQTNAALTILNGYQTDNTELYDADGTTVTNKNNSTIARA